MAPLTLSNHLGMLQNNPDSQEAREGLREALASGDAERIGQDPLRLLEAARAAHERRGEMRAAAWLIELEAEVVDDDAAFRAALYKELGRLRREELLDDPGAKEAYGKALELLAEDDDAEEAIEQLDQTAGNWRQIADRFVEEAEAASDATLKTSLLTRAAAIVWQYKKKGKQKEADKLFKAALASDPGDARAVRLYCETLKPRDKWDEVARVLAAGAENASNRDDRLHLSLHAGRVLAHKVGDKDRAATCFERVNDFAPGQEEALEFLVEYFTEREQWDHLVALYEDALRARQKLESEQGILLQLGMVHWRIRNAPAEAEPYFARLRKIDPAHPSMLDFYRSHLAEVGDHQRLISVLTDAQRVAKDGEQKKSLALELARAAQGSDATLERAIDAWKAVQRVDAENTEAQQALKDLYRRTEKWNALVEVLRAEVDQLPEDAKERRVALLWELVPIYRDKLGLDAMVINTYNAILQDVPDDKRALGELAQTYESMGRLNNDLIQVLSRQADAEEDVATKVGLLMRVANLWIERFANYNQATGPLEKVIEIDPENREALSQLKDIYTKKRAWKPLFHVLQKDADLTSDPDARLTLRIELAKLASDRLHRNADAIQLWRQVVDEAPDTEGALDALEKLAEREKDWATLADALERRASRTDDAGARIRVLQKLGSVYQDHLDDPKSAAGAWKRVLDADPKNGRALRTLREAFVASRDWEGLESLYAEAEDWEGLVDVLGGAAERAEDSDLKIQLSFRAAAVYEDRIGEPSRAFRNYERVLSVDPTNVRAARALAPIYEREEKWPRLAAMLDVIVAGLPEDASEDERLELLDRLRELASGQLRDAGRAFDYAARAFAVAPQRDDVVERLEAAAEAAGAHENLVKLYLERLESAGADEELRLRRRVAQVAGEKLGRSDEAIAQLQRVLERAPGDGDAVAVLDRLYRAAGRAGDLRTLYLHRLEQTSDDTERHTLLGQLAELEERELDDVASATERYRAMLEIDPADLGALRALDRAISAEGGNEELADVLLRRIELADDDAERVDLHLRLGDLRAKALNDADGAVDAFAEALRLAPGHERAVAGLEKLESDGDVGARAARLLEEAYEARDSHEKLAGVLRRRLEAATDDEEKRDLQLRLAELAGAQLGDVDGAYTAIESAFLDRPSDVEIWDRLASAAERANKMEALGQAYSTAIEAGDLDDATAAELAARAAELYEVVLARPAEAEAFHKRVLAHDPMNGRGFLALKELYTNHERWEDLQALYRNRIAETVDAEAKLELLLQVCFLFEEILDNPELAIRNYQSVIELEPEHVASRRALERLYRRTSRWRDLAALLRQELDRAEGQEVIDLTYELGEIHETKLEEPAGAVDLYESVLEQSPTHLRAQEALERLLSEPSQRQRIAGILEPIYETQGAWSELARVIEVQLEEVSDPGARVGLLTRVAEIHERKLQDADRAFQALARAVEADAADGRVREELARLSTERDAHRERAAVLERAVEQAEGSTYLQGELLFELARLWDEQERDVDNAERAYTRLIQVEPDNPDVLLPASRALERIHVEKGDQPALAEDLRRQIRFEDDQERKGSLLVRLADLLEDALEDVPGAIEAHQTRLEIDPANVDAMRSLERLHEQRGEWQALVSVLQMRDGVAESDDEQRAIGQRVGQIYEERLEDTTNAITAYNDVLSRFGQDRETLAALARLYERAETWQDLLEVVEMDHELAEEPSERAELRFRAAELMRTRLHETERAIEAYREVLEQVPHHAGAIAALERTMESAGEPFERAAAARVLMTHYEGSEAYDKVIRALEVIGQSDDPVEKLASLRRAAEVADVGLEDPARAFELMGQAVRAGLSEDDLDTMLANYERLAAASNRWSEYVATLREVAPEILHGDLQTEVLLKVADVAASRLDDGEGAKELYQRVLENRPDHTGALDALERLHEDSGEHPQLLDVIRRKTEIADDPTARVRLLLRQAKLCEGPMGDVAAAIDAYEQVLMDAEGPEAFEGLERLYRKAERWPDLASLYERQLDAGVGSAADVRFRLGQLCSTQLDDAHRALDHYREVLAHNRDHAETIAALEGMMDLEDHRGQAAELLEPVFLQRMDWPKVTAVLEARLASEVDIDIRKDLFRRMGQLYEDYLEDLEGGLEVYARLFHEDPRDREVWDTLGRLGRVLEKWDRLAEIYGAVLDEVSVDDEETAELAFLTAQLHHERTGDMERAARYYQRVITFDPTHREAFRALESVLEKLERWQALLDLYGEQVDVAENDEARLALLHKAAAIREQKLSDTDAAMERYREALEVNPYDPLAIEALDRLLTAAERWEDLADHLRHRIDGVVGTPDELDMKHRLGALLAERLGDTMAAVDVFEEVVQANPQHTRTVQALEQLVLDEDQQLRITHILEPIYRGSDQWMKLVAVLEAQANLSDDPAERMRLLGEIGRLHEERGGDLAMAFEAWSRAFAEEPHDDETRGQVDRIARQIGAWDRLVSAYETAIEKTEDPMVVTELLTTIARVQDEKLGDPRAAIETFERLLAHDPDDASPLDSLEALHTMLGDWRGMVDVFQRKVEQSLDPQERGELLRRAGAVLEELIGDSDAAVEAYRRATEEDHTDGVAFEALDRLHSSANRHEDVAEVLQRRLELETDPTARTELAMRLGALYETQLGRPEDAIDAYRRVLDDDPHHAEGVEVLGRLYERQALWPELLDNLRLRIELASEPHTQVQLLYRAGEVLERELDDTLEAIDTHRRVLELDSRHEPSLSALIRISNLEDYRGQAAEILEPLLHVQERWDDLAALVERKAEALTDPVEKRDELRRLAEVHENGRRDLPAAFEAMQRAFAEDPADEQTAHDLERMAGELGAWGALGDVLASRASSALDPTVARSLYTRLARVAEDRLEDDARAIEAYTRALEQVGDDEELLESLDRLQVKTQSLSELAETLERRAQLAVDAAQRNGILFRLAELRQSHFADRRGAFTAYQDILDQEPGNERVLAAMEGLLEDEELAPEVLDSLDRAYRETGATDRVVGLYDVRIRLAASEGEQVRLLQEAAGIWEQELGNAERALDASRRAFELDPRDETLLDEIERLAEATGGWESLRGVIEKVSESPDVDAMLLRDLNLRGAAWHRDRLGDAQAAEACLRRAVEADPESPEAHSQLVDLLQGPGREAERVEALRAWARHELDEFAKKDRLRQAAQVAEESLGDVTIAAACHEAILEADASDPDSLSDLARIREQQGRFDEVVELIARRVDVAADPAERLTLRRRLAELYAGPLESPDKAIEAYQGVLDEDPTSMDAIRSLEQLYEQLERWDDLRELIDRRLDIADSDEDRIAARVRLARLMEQAFGQRAEAMEQLREILDMDPSNGEALDELERLLAAEERWDDLQELLERRVGEASNDEDAKVLLRRLAELHGERRGDSAKAVETHERILERDPNDLESLRALAELHRSGQAWDRQAEVLERLIGLLEPSEAVTVALDLARLCEDELGDPSRTEGALLRARELDPAAEPIREQLKGHYEKHGEHAKVAEMLAEEAEAVEDTAARVALLKRIAGLYEEQLGDPATAATHLERASELVPEDREVLLPLCDLYIAAGRQGDAVPVLEKIVESFGNRRVKEVARYHHRLGKAHESMGDIPKALEHYDAAFKIDLTNVEILRDLGKLCHAQGDFDRAQKTFRALLLQKLGDGVGINKADVYFYLGDISAKQGDTTKAVSMLERAVAEQKGHPEASELLTQLKG
jgi:golgin subfamily B member 1